MTDLGIAYWDAKERITALFEEMASRFSIVPPVSCGGGANEVLPEGSAALIAVAIITRIASDLEWQYGYRVGLAAMMRVDQLVTDVAGYPAWIRADTDAKRDGEALPQPLEVDPGF
jgi:hypothetical protein